MNFKSIFLINNIWHWNRHWIVIQKLNLILSSKMINYSIKYGKYFKKSKIVPKHRKEVDYYDTITINEKEYYLIPKKD